MSRIVSFKPYLFNAYYEWFIGCGFTPYLQVNAAADGVKVPSEYVRDDRITLSIDPSAVADLHTGSKAIFFKAMFSGKSEDIVVPYAAMTALFAKEYDFGIPLGQALEAFDMSEGVAKQLSEELDDDDENGEEGPDFSEEDDSGEDDASGELEDDEEPEGDSAGFEFVKDDDKD
ncbi:MAG: ClpXP protease specificity-enhancing factor SspB [Succinivibrio sp.]